MRHCFLLAFTLYSAIAYADVQTNQPSSDKKKPFVVRKNPSSTAPSKAFLNDEGLIAQKEKTQATDDSRHPFITALCDKAPQPYRLSVSHREARGIGYEDGYSSLGLFLTGSPKDRDYAAFLDLRGHVFNNGKYASNVSLGFRDTSNALNLLFGVNASWDWRQIRDSHFNQVGGGIEILGARWNIRFNGYFPVAKTRIFSHHQFSEFSQNSALFKRHYSLAMKGGDIEVGGILVDQGFYDLRLNFGGYYFHGDFNKIAKGGLVRLSSWISPYLSCEVQGSYDTLFKGIVQGQIGLHLPFGRKLYAPKKDRSCDSYFYLEKRMVEPLSRFEIIVASSHRRRRAAYSSFVFVDNTKTTGDGTFENPFPTLLDAEGSSADVVYVFAGDGTSKNMNTGIILDDNQILQGSGLKMTVATPFGQETIPAFTDNFPTISDTYVGGAAVILANNNTVNGFNITNSEGYSIFGMGITDATITNNHMSGAALSDVALSLFSGTLTYENNTSSSTQNGLSLMASNVTALITNNTFAPLSTSFSGIDLTLFGSGTDAINITSNEFTNGETGISVSSFAMSTFTADISIEGNTIPAVDGVSFNLIASPIVNALINSNVIQTPGTNGLLFTGAGTSQGNLIVTDNIVTSSGAEGFEFDTTVSSTLNLSLYNNRNVNGFSFSEAGSSTFNSLSPTGTLSGVEDVNVGPFTTSGIITYILSNP
jgi:hypothetical protein